MNAMSSVGLSRLRRRARAKRGFLTLIAWALAAAGGWLPLRAAAASAAKELVRLRFDRKPLPAEGSALAGAPAGAARGLACFGARAAKPFRISGVGQDGKTRLSFPSGAVRIVFRPGWKATGISPMGGAMSRGPGHWARLFELGEEAEAGRFVDRLSLRLDPSGKFLALVSRDGSGKTATNFLCRVIWPTAGLGRMARPGGAPWAAKEIIVNFCPQSVEVIVDGSLQRDLRLRRSSGKGLGSARVSAARLRLAAGSGLDGADPAEGWIVEIAAFDAPVSPLRSLAAARMWALSASAAASPPAVSLDAYDYTGRPLRVRRRAAGSSEWTALPPQENAGVYLDRDPRLRPGNCYEYETGGRRIRACIDAAPANKPRSALILVDRTLIRRLGDQLVQFHRDLVAEGWRVILDEAPRQDDDAWRRGPINRAYIRDVAAVKSRILRAAREAPAPLAAVILVGHVVTPYSGSWSEDGHPGQIGAWPADSYYGDLDGEWPDRTVNTARRSRSALRRNVPGDGKFDLNFFSDLSPRSPDAAGVETAVGRIDFANMKALQPGDELGLLRRYFRKNHEYRTGLLRFEPRVLAGAFFGGPWHLEGRAIYANALALASRAFGDPEVSCAEGEAFYSGPEGSFLWAMCGGYGGSSALHNSPSIRRMLGLRPCNTASLSRQEPPARAAFYLLKGSYFGSWDSPNNFLRAVLAQPRAGLAVSWTRTKLWRYKGPAAGEPIGRAFIDTARGRASVRTVFLLGDPTLRFYTTPPPSGGEARREGGGVKLRWRPSPAPGARHFVYRSEEGLDGEFKLLTPEGLNAAEFVDPAPPQSGRAVYLIRAAERLATGSGTFWNLSAGELVEWEER
ncbi:MAG: hypothetical protein J7M29_05380 [Verrucomicrobia bacterium]|nr:hypothetical protein [Verrucomicrobiota bacterium]